ncbi:MAG: rhomboid family intramembrane serine protease [Methylophaga sp.]|nr:rhomboid family intramembrane serine protease [Methylophaga sp.]
MLIIPFDKKLEWQNPPIITLILIAVNVLIYFSFQLHDDEKMVEASHYYYRSGLAEIELPHFKKALIEQDDIEFVDEWQDSIKQEQSPWFFHMETNKAFMQALQNEQIITPSDPLYAKWKSKRTHLNEIFNNSVTWTYSLKAGDPKLLTFISHMFLHADFSHLFGNMIFLLAVGFIVELSMNRSIYLFAYLFTGICSALFYIPSASDSLIPSLGASGAIAGLMGMYAVLFNTRKVRFFYFIYVYFDYVKLPAIYLLVLWLGFEVYQQAAYSRYSNVNYLAHIGGLISGAFIAFIIVKFQSKHVNHDYLNEHDTNEEFNRTLNQANSFVHDLQFENAVPLFAQLVEKQPLNREVLFAYYKTSKLDVNSEAHHRAATAILSLSENDAATNQLVIDTFNDYLSTAKVRLTVSLVNKLIRRFISINAFLEADKLILFMQKYSDKFNHLPQYLWSLTNKLVRSGQREQAMKYSQYLLSSYPAYKETQLAKDLLA